MCASSASPPASRRDTTATPRDRENARPSQLPRRRRGGPPPPPPLISDPARTFLTPKHLLFHERSSMTPSATAILQIQEADGAAEARWVIAARAGDPEAALRLLTRYRPPLLRLLTGLTGDLATAEDVVQE